MYCHRNNYPLLWNRAETDANYSTITRGQALHRQVFLMPGLLLPGAIHYRETSALPLCADSHTRV